VGFARDLDKDPQGGTMCWACDHPDSARLDYLNQCRDDIGRHGWIVQGVERQGIRPPWVYTIGLTTHRKPEIVVTGLPVGRAAEMANDVAAYIMDGTVPAPGERGRLGAGGPLIEFVGVAVPTAHLNVAVELFGPGVRALQVVHADDRGHWPWDRGYRGVRGGQPVLGARAEAPARPRSTL
jgi:hypothetical protein